MPAVRTAPFLAGVALAVLACASHGSGGTPFFVSVDAISDASRSHLLSYVLMPGVDGVEAGDLYFREYAGYVARALDSIGFQPVSDPSEADFTVLVSYGIGEPQVSSHIYSIPNYASG
jgi:hypothetical protein